MGRFMQMPEGERKTRGEVNAGSTLVTWSCRAFLVSGATVIIGEVILPQRRGPKVITELDY